jgi:ATP-dependent DNA helicase RecG
VEFKAQMPLPQDTKSRRTVLKAVPAFANGAGGVLIIGVDEDGKVVGVPDLTDEQVWDRLTSLIRDTVHPVPPF